MKEWHQLESIYMSARDCPCLLWHIEKEQRNERRRMTEGDGVERRKQRANKRTQEPRGRKWNVDGKLSGRLWKNKTREGINPSLLQGSGRRKWAEMFWKSWNEEAEPSIFRVIYNGYTTVTPLWRAQRRSRGVGGGGGEGREGGHLSLIRSPSSDRDSC